MMLAVAAVLATAAAAWAGNGVAFAPAANFPTQSSLGPGPGAVTTVAGDVDGDGDIDVVMTDWFGGGPLVLRNDGAGAFGPPTTIAGAAGVGALAAADVDRDGHLDLVGRDDSGVVVLLGNGDGTFRVSDTEAVSANAQQSVAVEDTNGDGRLDIVTPARTGI